MLVLSRKVGEKIVIDGKITLQVVGARNNRVRLAFDAPREIPILRSELVTAQEVTPEVAETAST